MYNNQNKIALMLCSIGMSITSFQGIAQEVASFSLDEAKKYAVENSYMSLSAQKEIIKSEKKINETISTGLPQINASASYQKYLETPVILIPGEAVGVPEEEFVEVFFGTEQQMSVGARVDQLIFNGSYFVGLQASKVYLELSKNDLQKTELEVKSMITAAYGGVLVAERNVEILKENIISLEKSAFETEQLYKNGFIEEQDKDQIQLTLTTVKNNYNNAVRLVAISRNQLKFIMGVEVASTITLTDDLNAITTNYSGIDYLSVDYDVNSHIDYKIVNTQLKATELLLKEKKSTVLPSLSAFYAYQQNSYSKEFNFLGKSEWFPTQLVGLNLDIPLFSGLGRYNRIEQAKIELDQVSIAKRQVEQSLKINAQNAKSEYTYALSTYNSTKDNMELAERIYNKTKLKYEEGISTSLDLTQANNQLLNVQAQHIQAALQLIQAKANLEKALNQ